MLDIKQLLVLREVGARGSFSAAADALSYTQSAVSKQIAALERQTGVTLVQRGVRPVRLTHAGRVLVEHADAALAHLSAAEAQLEALAGMRAGRVDIGCFSSAGAAFVADAVWSFRTLHPGVQVGVVEGGPAELEGRTLSGELDIAVSFSYPPHDDRDPLERIPLFEDPFAAVLPAGQPLADTARVTLSDLAGLPWFLPKPTTGQPGAVRQLMLRACAEAGFQPDIAIEVNDCQMVQSFVAAGMGVSLLPVLALYPVRADVAIVPVDDAPPSRRVFAARLPPARRSPAAEALLAELLTAVRCRSVDRAES